MPKAKQRDKEMDKLWRSLMGERKGYLPKDFPAVVERDVTGAGKYAQTRRYALFYLTKPWKETTKSITKSDKKAAAALKEWAEYTQRHAQAYRDLAGWMEIAAHRMQLALCVRK